LSAREREGLAWWATQRKNREGERWADRKGVGPTGGVLKIAFSIISFTSEFKPISYSNEF
jgi:hypothetical protein